VVALLASAAVARHLPVAADTRYAVAFLFAIPAWLVAMCLAFASDARRSGLWCLALSALLALLVFGVPVQ
jgi:hypothetical protein